MTTYSLEFVSSYRDIDAALWERCFPPPREGCFWYRTLEESGLESQFSFSYGIIRTQGKPIGIVPCFCHDVPISLVAPAAVTAVIRLLSHLFPKIDRQRTLFVGSPCSDEGTIGLLPEYPLRELAPAVIDAVAR